MKNSIALSVLTLSALFLVPIQAEVKKVQDMIEKLQQSLDKLKNKKIVLNKEVTNDIKTLHTDIKNLDYEIIGLSSKDFDELKKSIIKNNKVSKPLFNVFLSGSGDVSNPHFIFADATSIANDLLNQIDKNKATANDVVTQLKQIIARLGDDTTSFSNKNQ